VRPGSEGFQFLYNSRLQFLHHFELQGRPNASNCIAE
jgi:hypothetical protein